jgi:hypothetical protein
MWSKIACETAASSFTCLLAVITYLKGTMQQLMTLTGS